MELLGYLLSILIGISLGLLGAGGSILTVPVLVYFFKIEPLVAVKNSLFLVGITSAVACLPKLKKGEILLAQGGMFALISIAVVILTRRIFIPLIPNTIYHSIDFSIEYGTVSMLAFALLMAAASRYMIKSIDKDKTVINKPAGDEGLLFSAIGTGLLTGLLGAGGGFVIVPTLMIFFRVDLKKAIGTSLFIIALNSLSGFVCDFGVSAIQWPLIITITVLSIGGSLVGQRMAANIPTRSLRKAFGWFILSLAIVLFCAQVYDIAHPRKNISAHRQSI